MGRDLTRYEELIDEIQESDGKGLDSLAFIAGMGAILRRLSRIGRPSALADVVDGLTQAMEERGAVVALKPSIGVDLGAGPDRTVRVVFDGLLMTVLPEGDDS